MAYSHQLTETRPLSEDDVANLKRFHSAHLLDQPIPDIHPNDQARPEPASQVEEDTLGYYEDGVKRTLTDEQIKLLRHSEIQRLLQKRRLKQQKEIEKSAKADRDAARPAQRLSQRGLDDDAAHEPGVESLTYDDESKMDTEGEAQPGEKKFLWPRLGS